MDDNRAAIVHRLSSIVRYPTMSQAPYPIEEPPAPEVVEQPRRGHQRRPPLAEIDSWELWQAWKRGERAMVAPWIGLLVGFCVVLAAVYSFFFYTTSITDDSIAQVVLTIVFLGFLFSIWRRISARRDFAFMIVALILAVSGGVFLLWLLLYNLSGWNPCVAYTSTLGLGLLGLSIGLRSLNVIGGRNA